MMIRLLELLWQHTPDLPEVAVITSDPGKTFCELIRELIPAFETEGIVLKFTSSVISDPAETQSFVTLNRRCLEDLLLEVAEEQRQCEGRRCEMVIPITFPVVTKGEILYLKVPDLIIRKVFLRATGHI